MNSLPEDAEARNAIPLADGLLDYFPNALCEVAKVSAAGNKQHNGDAPLHWARGKSTDHRNKIARHLIDAGGKDSKGIRHSAYLAWRALALLQEELEAAERLPLPRNARGPQYGELIPHQMAAAAMRDGVRFDYVDEYVITANSPPPPDDDEGLTPAEAPREHAA